MNSMIPSPSPVPPVLKSTFPEGNGSGVSRLNGFHAPMTSVISRFPIFIARSVHALRMLVCELLKVLKSVLMRLATMLNACR